VILLPENLFYNTTAPGIILVVNRRKRRPGEILLINASQQFAKGRPRTT
jgi:N-6 DNA Methylase.